MSSKAKSGTTKDTTTSRAKATPSTDFQSELQKRVDKENAQGFRGTEVDPTPNENYTVAGVTSGAPTPETHPDTAKDARGKTGIGLSGVEAAARERGE